MALSSKMIADGGVWAFNSSSAVGIIFINKILMSSSGYGFQFGGALHPDVWLEQRFDREAADLEA
jgi:hypothetical protein